MTASKPEVLPCPFCGADPLEHAIEPHSHGGALKALGVPDHSGSHTIECGCGAGMIAEAKEAVRAMWNRRDMYSYVEPRAGVPEVAGYDVFESESCSHVLLLPKEMAKVRLRLSASATALIRLTDHEAARAADKARIAELEAALSDVERDAARYRWLCSAGPGFDSRPFVVLLDLDSTKSDVDTAIDAALAQQGKE